MQKGDQPSRNQGDSAARQAPLVMPPPAPDLTGRGVLAPPLLGDWWADHWVGHGAPHWSWNPSPSNSAPTGRGKGEASPVPVPTPQHLADATVIQKGDQPSGNQDVPPARLAPTVMPHSALLGDWWTDHWVGHGAPRWNWKPSSPSSAPPGRDKGEAPLADAAVIQKSGQPSGNQGEPASPSVMSPSALSGDWWTDHWVGHGAPRWSWNPSPPSPAPPGRVKGEGSAAPHPATGPPDTVSTSDDASRRLAYNVAAKIGRGSAEASKAEDEALLASIPTSLRSFLNQFTKVGEQCAYYKSQIDWLKRRGCPKLTVDFEDLLQNRENWDLAFAICNHQEVNASFLKQAVRDFFVENGLDVINPQIEFTQLPRRIHKARDFLTSSDRAKSVSLMGGALTTVVATAHGKKTFGCILSGVLDSLTKGVSWNGQLTLDDMLVMEYGQGHLRLMIMRPPVIEQGAADAEKSSDLNSVWTIMEPYYKLSGKLPLYFVELKEDLEKSANSIQSDWFLIYLRFHPAFYSSTSRSNFVCKVHQCYKDFNLASDRKYSNAFGSFCVGDWRGVAKSCDILKKVYYYRWRNDNLKQTDMDRLDKRQDRMGDLLEFKRHSLIHVEEYATVADVDEIELFTSHYFTWFLPTLLKKLLAYGLMGGKLFGAWSNYVASKSDNKEAPGI